MKNKNTYIYIIGAGLGYFFILKPLLQKLGILKTSEETEQQNVIDKFTADTIKKIKPTKSPGEIQIIADQIYQDLRYSALDDNKSNAVYQICRVQNDGDVALLIKSFGKRQEYLFGLPSGQLQDLQQFVTSNLSNKQKAIINDNYKRKNIKYRF